MRVDERAPDELRECSIEPDFQQNALASALISTGKTRVLCSASIEPKPPSWLASGGWVTAQYSMLPGATAPRGRRDPGGRGKEIQRLIGRSLRACVDLSRLVGPNGGVSIIVDCDVIDADGGTRTASITGGYVALALALARARASGVLAGDPIRKPVAAVSVGLVVPPAGKDVMPMLDLCYLEDAAAGVDLNVVALEGGGLVEVQGTAEAEAFSRAQLDQMLDLAEKGIARLHEVQRRALEAAS